MGQSLRPESQPQPADVADEAVALAAQQGHLVAPTAATARRTQGDAAPRRRGRDNPAEWPRSSSPTPPTPPPLPPLRRLRNRSRSRSPLSPQGDPQGPNSRLAAAYYSAAVACSSCQKASLTPAPSPTAVTSGIGAAHPELYAPPSDSDYSSAGSAATTPPSKGIMFPRPESPETNESEVQSLLKSLQSLEGAADGGEPSPPLQRKLPDAQSILTGVVGEVEQSLRQPDPASPEGGVTDGMESPNNGNVSSPQSLERAPAPGPVSLASSQVSSERHAQVTTLASSEVSSERHAQVTSLAPSEVSSERHAQVTSLAPSETEPSPLITSPPQQDGTPLSSLSEQSPARLASESGDARQSDTKASEEDIDVGIMIAPSAFDGFFFGVRDDDKDKTDYFEQVRLRTLQSFDVAAHTPGEGSQDGDQLATDGLAVEADVADMEMGADDACNKETVTNEMTDRDAVTNEMTDKDTVINELTDKDAVTSEAYEHAVEEVGDEPEQGREDSGPAESVGVAQGPPSPPAAQSDLTQTDAGEESNYEFDVSSGRTEISDEYSVDVDVTSRQTEVSVDLESNDRVSESENDNATTAPRLADDTSESAARCSDMELMEIARTSMALTAASSSVPDSESIQLIDQVAVDEEDEEPDTTEGAGDDSLVGCDMDLKHVTGVLFDPTPQPPQTPPDPLPSMALTKGGSLPAAAATSAADESRPQGPQGRADRKLAGFGGFPFKTRRRQDKAQRSATASALIPCPEPARAPAPPREDVPPTTSSTTTTTTRRLSVDLKVADVKQVESAGASSRTSTSTHRILSDVLQGIRQVILPGKSGRRGIMKRPRSGHRLLSRKAPAAEKQREVDAEDEQAPAEDTSTAAADEQTSVLRVAGEDEACSTTTVASSPREARSERPSRTSSDDKNAPAGVKKNHVEPSPVTDVPSKLRYPASTRSNISRSNCEEISETHSRTSRSSIAPPRTNFLTDNVLKSLARSSSIKYIDSTLRSTQRIAGKTPERYRNVPLPITKPESSKANTPTASQCSSPRSRGSRKGFKLRKRIKISETAICTDNSGALNCLTDHKENNKYYVYTVNDDKATELRLSEMFVLQEEPIMVEEVPQIQEPAEPVRAKVKAKKGGNKKEGKAAKAPKSKSKQGGPSTAGKMLRKKSLTRPASLLRSRRSGERLRGSKNSARTSKAALDKKASSALSIKKRQTEVLKRLRQFSPSDGVVEIVSDASKCESVEQSDTATQFRGELTPRVRADVRDSCTGDTSSVVSAAVSAAVSRGQSQLHSRAPSSVQSRESCGPRRTSARRGAPRYRPTLRTPRITCVGMGAGNEVALVQRNNMEAGALGRARIPFKHPAHGAKVPQAALAHRELAGKAITATAKPVQPAKSHTPAFPGLHEMTEMLFEYSTLAAAKGRSFANVHSELVSLFEAPTKASLPSNESHGGISDSANPSADQVLVGLRRAEVDSSSQATSSAGVTEETGSSQLSEAPSSKQTTEHTEETDSCQPTSAASSKQYTETTQPSGFRICSVDTEAQVAAALQEIMNSLTELRCTGTDGALGPSAEGLPVTQEAKDNKKVNDGMATRRAGGETVGNAHLHGLRYFPAKGVSTFDILDTILIEESHSRLQSKPLDSTTRPGLSVKINTWTSENINITSNSVQATVSTANAVCQRTRISSPEDASIENLPKPNFCQTDQNLVENSKLFEKRTTPIEMETSKAQGPSIVCAEKHSHPNNFCIDTIDMSSEFIPRSHNDTIETENSVRSRHSPILLPSTSFTKTKSKHEMSKIATHHEISATSMSQAKLTGPQRAQKRIACFLGDDIPGTVLAVLTEVLPIFLERTRSELQTPRQNLIQKLLYEDYFSHPANTSDGQNAREDPQARLRVGTMAHQVSLLVEDAARSAELVMQGDRRPP